ncbi:MAG TPA: type II toxin-antitoxin system VapC family toxin [Chloroflexota bacterium]|nr:type II toxin-antitoxin system VapC family toxin [Chloroflexota bacterium]
MGSSELDRELGDVERILLDTSVLIAFHSPHERVHDLADHIMSRIENQTDRLRGYYSALSASELLVRPIRTSVEHFTHMQAFLVGFPNLTILPVDLVVAGQAATLRAITRLHLADALVIATGLVAGCQAIVTNDERWMRQVAPLFNQFQWIYLDRFL